MESMTVFRSRFGRVFTVSTWVVLAVAQAPVLFPVDINGIAHSVPLTALLGFSVWAAFWRPALSVDDRGIRIRNVLADYDVEWGAVQQVDTKWGLTIFTAIGKITAWAAPAPGRHSAFTASKDQGRFLPESTYLVGTIRPGDLSTSESGAAAAHIRRVWETRRDEDGVATRRVNLPVIAAFAVLVLATAISLSV